MEWFKEVLGLLRLVPSLRRWLSRKWEAVGLRLSFTRERTAAKLKRKLQTAYNLRGEIAWLAGILHTVVRINGRLEWRGIQIAEAAERRMRDDYKELQADLAIYLVRRNPFLEFFDGFVPLSINPGNLSSLKNMAYELDRFISDSENRLPTAYLPSLPEEDTATHPQLPSYGEHGTC